MTVAFGAASAWFDGATGLTADKVLTLPTHATGNLILLLAAWKDFGITAQVAGYTEVTEYADGSVATGNGTGSMKVGAWYKEATSGSETNPTLDFSTTTGLLGEACVLVFSRTADSWVTPTFGTNAWPSGTGGTIGTSSTQTVPDGGAVVALFGFRNDEATCTRPTNAISSVGGVIVWNGNYVESPATHASTTTGNDMSADCGYRLVTTGGTGVTPNSTITTLSTAETGAVLWVIVGDVSAAAANPPYTSPYPPLLAQ